MDGAHLLRLSLLCRMGVYSDLDIRPSEVVPSTAALFRSACCTGLDWWRKMSTSDLPKKTAAERGRRVEARTRSGRKRRSHLGMWMSLFRGRRATLLKAILTPTATTSVKEITPPIT